MTRAAAVVLTLVCGLLLGSTANLGIRLSEPLWNTCADPVACPTPKPGAPVLYATTTPAGQIVYGRLVEGG